MKQPPSYLKLHENGVLEERADKISGFLKKCVLCPHKCLVDRTAGETGKCRSGYRASVASFHGHFGEERCISGSSGSGTIFFANCNLACVFCQNWDISHGGIGEKVSPDELARIMISLQNKGCHNINFVTPTHVTASIVQALPLAVDMGLRIPLVYNSGGYDSVEILKLLDGIIDIYMPDFKFMDGEQAFELCGAEDYPESAQAALSEMHSQTGDLVKDSGGIAVQGVLVRHLVLPDNIAATDRVLHFLASFPGSMSVNIMDQYRPAHKAKNYKGLGRGVTLDEYDRALELAEKLGLSPA